jgi:hypothetical protein
MVFLFVRRVEGPFWIGMMIYIKEIIKIRSRQHEHTSQCDGPAWLTSELGWSKPPHHVKVIHSGRWIGMMIYDSRTEAMNHRSGQ